MKSLLKLVNVDFNPFQAKAIIKQVNLDIYEHDFLVLVGGNGSGKSSLIKLINRAYQQSSGSIYFEDKLINQYPFKEITKKILTLNQSVSNSLFMDLTIEENAIILEMNRVGPRVSFNRKKFLLEIKDYLSEFNKKLSVTMKSSISRLSGGEQQILAFALYLRNKPSLLLLDEHVSALDPRTSDKIMEFTQSIITKHGITCLMTTHNLDYALKYGTRLVAIKEGELIFEANNEQKKKLDKKSLLEFCY